MLNTIPQWLILLIALLICAAVAIGYRILTSLRRHSHHELQHRDQQTRQLEANEAFSNRIIESMPSMIIGVDANLHVTRWNTESETQTGLARTSTIGKAILLACPALPFSEDIIRETIERDQSTTFESAMTLPNNAQSMFVSVIIYPVNDKQQRGAVIRIDNITQRVKLERMLIQDDKLVSLGRMAAGLAHEVNNPLAAILSSAKTIERRLIADIDSNREAAQNAALDFSNLQHYLENREIKTLLEGIKASGERAAYIVKSMLDFSHSSDQVHEPIYLAELLRQSLAIAEQNFPRSIRHHLSIETHIPDPAPIALGIAVEIEQVLVNVLSNAADALDEFRRRHSDTAFQPKIDIRVQAQKEIVMIDIADNGPGIEPDKQKAIFEPFYTTKSVGQGTGLGLAISYFIMTEHHRGSLDVFSDEDGSCFRISLPRSLDKAS